MLLLPGVNPSFNLLSFLIRLKFYFNVLKQNVQVYFEICSRENFSVGPLTFHFTEFALKM